MVFLIHRTLLSIQIRLFLCLKVASQWQKAEEVVLLEDERGTQQLKQGHLLVCKLLFLLNACCRRLIRLFHLLLLLNAESVD
jgi:hypothetical protein